jgi:hypothetical protein
VIAVVVMAVGHFLIIRTRASRLGSGKPSTAFLVVLFDANVHQKASG